ncbi:unnamed protein product [Aphanomyces euteiches]|uniref:Uncharacterized protein n=1 Tax=Aphanomyces euteiches TaxID=100861 RepID=A0A6G0XJM0_9STRA|nr:hypothetical protein Ae201684_003945 [Aphanomyces euteiches]KAH9084779.1 hypothetical protein Ae201684P_002019 [Aphanomyces euteiches]KAH9157320.1 hypothetical protein AeRB84_000850 [Aphanomyces euteiches]
MSRDERRWLLPHQADGPKTSYFQPGRRAIALLVAGILAFYVAGAIHLHGALEPPQEKDAGQRDGDGRVELDAAHISFPLDCSFRQYTLSADDEGLAYISGNGRAFRSDHTNLFGRGVTGKIISVDANAFLLRSNGECCRFMDSGDEILLKPTSFFNYRSVGNAVFDTAMATLWVDPEQASMFWQDANGLPLRWDYIPKSPAGKRITAGKMMSMVFTNFTLGPQDRILFDVPASCTTAQRCRFD